MSLLFTTLYRGFPGDSEVKASACNVGDLGSMVAQRLKCMLAMWETWVQSLDWEDPLEKEMATHSSILAWRILWMEEPGGLQSTGSQRVGHDWATSLSLSRLVIAFLPGRTP